LASALGTLEAMRGLVRTGAAVRSAQATRRDLLLETLALRHQLGVLARSNKRFRPADRLFWLLLRWLWSRWREALVLIQSATVDRWHREGVRRCWRRRSRRPGRPRIDASCRDLIRRMAAENCLWGAPRIHGELLKLGIAVSERTVSRYLHGRPTTRSQSWRTFFANHFGQAFISPDMFADAPDEDILVDTSDLSFRPTRSIDASYASIDGASVDWGGRPNPRSLACDSVNNHLQHRPGARKSGGRDPPPASTVATSLAVRTSFFSWANLPLHRR
jgi:Homeodomain-like domain